MFQHFSSLGKVQKIPTTKENRMGIPKHLIVFQLISRKKDSIVVVSMLRLNWEYNETQTVVD